MTDLTALLPNRPGPGRCLAYMFVAADLLEQLLPRCVLLHCAEHFGAADYVWLRRLLLLPETTTVLAVSPHAFFRTQMVVLRLADPAFVCTQEAQLAPEVEAVYGRVNGKPVFVHYRGPALATRPGPAPVP